MTNVVIIKSAFTMLVVVMHVFTTVYVVKEGFTTICFHIYIIFAVTFTCSIKVPTDLEPVYTAK